MRSRFATFEGLLSADAFFANKTYDTTVPLGDDGKALRSNYVVVSDTSPLTVPDRYAVGPADMAQEIEYTVRVVCIDPDSVRLFCDRVLADVLGRQAGGLVRLTDSDSIHYDESLYYTDLTFSVTS